MLISTQGTEDGIGRRAHATLQGQELLGDTSLVHLLHEELCRQIANLLRHRITVLEGTGLIGDVALHNTHHLILRNRHVWLADAVAYVLDGDSLAVRRIKGLIHVVDELRIRIMEGVELQDHMLSQTGCRR